MPINFQPAEPLRPDVSQGYGAAEQFDRSLPTMQRYQQGIADAYLQAASLRQRASQSSAALQLQGAEQTHALDQRGYEANLHAQMQQQQMAHQSDMQAQHAQLQDQLAANQLSRGEQMRLQRLQEARGQVQDMVSSGTLTADEGRATLTEIQTGINPLQQRHQRFQQQMQEFQYKQMQQQAARQDQLWEERTQYKNRGLGGNTSAYVSDNGDVRNVVRGVDGSVDWHATQLLFGHQYGGGEHAANVRGGGAGVGGTGGGTGGGEGAGRGAGRVSEGQLVTIQNQVIQRMDEEVRNAPEGQKPPWANDGAAWRAQFRERVSDRVQNAQEHTQVPQQTTQGQTDAAEVEATRLAATRAENLRNREALHSGRMQLPEFQRRSREQGQLAVLARQARRDSAQPAPLLRTEADLSAVRPFGTREMTEAAVAGLPEAARPAARELRALATRPFTGGEIERMPEEVRPAAQTFNSWRERLGQEGSRGADGRPLTDQQRQTLLRDVSYAQQLLVQYGSVAAMPQGVRHIYDNATARVAGVQSGPPSQPQGQGGNWAEETNRQGGLAQRYVPSLWERFNSGLTVIGEAARRNRLTPPPTQPGQQPLPPPPNQWFQ